MHTIRSQISLGVVTVLRNYRIVASTAFIGDAHETVCTAGPSLGRPVYERSIEVVMRHLGRVRMTPKLERMIRSGVVRDGDTLVLLTWPEPDDGR